MENLAMRLSTVPTLPIDVAVEGVTHVYASADNRVKALEDVSFEVPRQHFVGVVGPSGCGKSSLLLMLAGLLRPTEGRILIREKELTRPEPTEIGVVFQEASLLPWKTALENVEFPLKLRNVPKGERRDRALELIEDRKSVG